MTVQDKNLIVYNGGELQKMGATDALTVADLNAANFDASGTLNADGAATLADTLSVGGATSLLSTLGVSGATTLAALDAQASTLASASVTGNASVGGTLDVVGKSTLGDLDAQASVLDSLTVVNAAAIGGTLDVTGASTLAALDAQASTLASASITGNASVGGTFAVTGASTFTGDMAAGNIDSATLDASGNVTIGGTLDVTGASSMSTLSTSGLATLDSASVTNALSAGSATISGSLSAGASTLGNTTVGGTLGVSGAATLSDTLSVAGASTLDSLAVTNNASVGGTLGVTGAATLSSTLAVSGNATVGGTLGVTGKATMSGDMQVNGNSVLGGTMSVAGAATMSDTLNVSGVAVFSDDVNVAGDLTVNGSIVSRGQVDVVISDAFLDLAFGDYSGAVTSGGFTVSMNKASGFTVEDVTDFAAASGGADPSFTVSGATSFAIGDIVAIANAGDSENDGLFAIKAIAGSVISIDPASIGSAPFLQNSFKDASSQTAKAYKIDLAAVAVADGSNFPQSGGSAFPKGTFVTLYKAGATVSSVTANGAWQSVGEVGLNEAYGVDNHIDLVNGRDLLVAMPSSGSAAIQYTSNAASFYRTADAGLALGVWDAAATNAKSKVEFAANGVDWDISLSSAASINLASKDISELAKGGAGSWKVMDGAGSTLKGELSISQAGGVSLTANGGKLALSAGDSNILAVESDAIFKADFGGNNYASLGYNLAVGAGLASAKVVSASGAAASPTAPNVLGVTLAAESGGKANVCTMHGSLVQVSQAAGASFNVGDVAYLAAGGAISNVAPSASGDYVMRVGYIVAVPAGADPVVQFAPQFIAKIL